jgi:hypothetical protein
VAEGIVRLFDLNAGKLRARFCRGVRRERYPFKLSIYGNARKEFAIALPKAADGVITIVCHFAVRISTHATHKTIMRLMRQGESVAMGVTQLRKA